MHSVNQFEICILLVENDLAESIEITRSLELLGIKVHRVTDLESARLEISTQGFDLVMIHIGGSAHDGLRLCAEIRVRSNVPILMLTSRSEDISEHMAVSVGADDYILKPVHSTILVSRVLQQLERLRLESPAESMVQGDIVFGPFKISPLEHQFWVNEDCVYLTPAEFKFFELLISNPRRVFTRVQIHEALGTFDGLGSDHLIDNHASRIRKKVREVSGLKSVEIVRGTGFRLSPQ
jgi:two-component system, OmpR family, response regulator RegX3